MAALTIESVMEMWKEDCQINQSALDAATVKNALLHQKYLDMLCMTKLRLRRKEQDMRNLEKDKFLYYTGKMTREEIDARGWAHDPFGANVKPMKSDMEYWFNSDKDIQELKLIIEYQKTLFDALAEIMENIKWRHQHIKNIIDFRKFESGA